MKTIFHLSRAEQVADHLRGCIARGELAEPLPSTRAWCETIGVSRNTLKTALKILQRDGLLRIEPRKPIRIQGGRRAVTAEKTHPQQVVRVIYYRRDYPDRSLMETYPDLAERLHAHDIHATLEGCTHARIRSISRQPLPPHELLLLASLPVKYHRYFAHMARNAMILGHAGPSSPLPYLTVDLAGCVRHAAQLLMRQGHSRISFLINRGSSQGVLDAIAMFERTCATWSRQPITADTVRMRLEFEAHQTAARRFAARIHARHGVIVMQPVSLSMVMTALLERGVEIPGRAQVIALMTNPESIKVCPTPPHYPFPMRSYVRQLTEAVQHYFETGALPRVRRVIPVELVPAGA